MATKQLSLKDKPADDVVSGRLLAFGCLLLLLPVLVVFAVFGYLGSPLLTLLLPRGSQPVAAAAPDEALVLVTTIEANRDNPANEIDAILLDEIREMPYYSNALRAGRILQTPTSHAEARSLGEQYDARLVLWGSMENDDLDINFTLLQPIHLIEPREFSFTIEDTDEEAYQQIALFSLALMEYRNSVLYYGGYVSVSEWLNRLPFDDEDILIDPVILTYYEAELERIHGNNVQAQFLIEDGLEAYGDQPPLLLMDSVLLRASGNLDAALEAVDKALELDDSLPGAYQLRANIYGLTNQPDLAVEDLSRALELEPSNLLILQERAEIYTDLLDYDAAIADYEALLDVEPNRYTYHMGLADIYRQLDDRDAALAAYEQAVEVARFDLYSSDALGQAYQERADYYVELQEYDLALADYDELQFISPLDQSYVVGKGIIYWEMGDEATARASWENDLTVFSYDVPVANNNLAWELALEGYYEAALPYAEKAVALNSKDPNLLHTLGFVYLGLGRYDEAVTHLDDSVNAGLYYDAVYRDLGDAFLGLGQYDQAIANYELYLRLLPFAEDAEQVEENIAQARQQLTE